VPRNSTEETLQRSGLKSQPRAYRYLRQLFEIGGDSLLSMRLMEQIQKFVQEIPLSPSSWLRSHLANSASEVDSLPWSPLVPIQPAGDKPPSSASIQSWVLSFLTNWHHLGHDQPFYGLQQTLGLDGEQPLYRNRGHGYSLHQGTI